MKLIDLSIGYPQGKSSRVVMKGINAELHKGRLTCLIGANGAGKSTLLRTISAFQPKLGGDIIIRGRKLEFFSREELARLIGVVLTERPSVQHLTARQMVAMGRSPYTGFFGRLSDEDNVVVTESMRMVGIEHLAERMVHSLSDGERQKMMTAKALAQQTDVIFLDERRHSSTTAARWTRCRCYISCAMWRERQSFCPPTTSNSHCRWRTNCG